MEEKKNKKFPRKEKLILLVILLTALLVLFAGLRRDLPYSVHVDETFYVSFSTKMAQEGEWNPGWFGNPGSTVIYPLTAVYSLWHYLVDDVPDFFIAPEMVTYVQPGLAPYYYIGRLLTVFYTLLTLPIAYLIGRRLFNSRVGLLATLLMIFYSVLVFHAQMVRTDSAGMFWGCLSFWLCLLVYDKQTWWAFLLAGLAIGSAIATRYFMVVLIPVFGIVVLYLLWQKRGQAGIGKLLGISILGGVVIGVGFLLWTPYFILDFDTAVSNIRFEARSEHSGADGLSPLQNLWWYISVVFWRDLGWVQMIFVGIGMVVVLWKRQFLPILSLIFVGLFLFATIISPLHWPRWIIQIMPFVALYAAYGFWHSVDFAIRRFQWPQQIQRVLVVIVLILTMWHSVEKTVRMDYKFWMPSTNVLARQWMIDNVPEQSRVIAEWYGIPLAGTSFIVNEVNPLWAKSWQAYKQEGYDVLVVSSGSHGRFYYEPERFAEPIKFYETLSAETTLLQEFQIIQVAGWLPYKNLSTARD